MLFRTMALEEPSIRTLNYAPGPIDTSMQRQARTETADPELKTLFHGKIVALASGPCWGCTKNKNYQYMFGGVPVHPWGCTSTSLGVYQYIPGGVPVCPATNAST